MRTTKGWVEKRERNGRITYRARYQDPHGDWHVETFDRKRDADEFLADTKREMKRGTWIDPENAEMLLREWAADWLDSKRSIKPKTRAGYKSLLRSRILPTFGDVPLGHIRPLDVETWVDAMDAEELSASRIRQAHQCLNAMLKAAVRSEMIFRNPAQGVELPSGTSSERRFLTAEQVATLADAFPTHEYRTLIYVLAYGGLRFGEAAALRRKDADLLRKRLVVAENLSNVGGELIFTDTKNHRVRTIQLPTFVVEMLARHMEDVDDDPEALIFTSPKGHPLRYSNFRRNFWNPSREEAGLPDLTPHDLRHTCASLLRAMGADAKAVQAQLGHSSVQVTLDTYTHLFEGALDDVMSAVDAHHRGLSKESAGGSDGVDRSESHTHSTPSGQIANIHEIG